MSSRMEQMIDEIEGYIESCRSAAFSSTKIIVDKEELSELITELRVKTPEEIKRYQKIISNKEAILADAQTKADQIIKQAQVQTSELISEHQIMQQAFQQANEVVDIATAEAQEILDTATKEANDLRQNAVNYMDGQLKSLQDILTNSIETSKARYESLISALQGFLNMVNSNRAEVAQMMGGEQSKKPEKDNTKGQEIGHGEDSGETKNEGFSEVHVSEDNDSHRDVSEEESSS